MGEDLRGTVGRVHAEVQKRAHGCIAVVSISELATSLGKTRRTIFGAVRELQKRMEVERIYVLSEDGRAGFHLVKGGAHAGSACGKNMCPQVAEFLRRYGRTEKASSLQGRGVVKLFSTERTESEAREDCEECRGTGYKVVELEGVEGKRAVRCGHEVARLVRPWRLAPLSWWEEEKLRKKPVVRLARVLSGEQQAMDFAGIEIRRQKEELARRGWLRKAAI